MAEKLDKLEQKKKELEAEIEQIQHELDQNVDGVRSEVSRSFSPDRLIGKYPLPALGASVLLGFLLGHEGRRSREGGRSGSSGRGISDALLDELRRLATKKAIRFAGDYLEELLEDKALGGMEGASDSEEE
ncbi:MAG: hypothetical protein U5K31_12990 [Balneolaceae bacterium]|nr:hypothetical protein [Balneolaceae bacterium]